MIIVYYEHIISQNETDNQTRCRPCTKLIKACIIILVRLDNERQASRISDPQHIAVFQFYFVVFFSVGLFLVGLHICAVYICMEARRYILCAGVSTIMCQDSSSPTLNVVCCIGRLQIHCSSSQRGSDPIARFYFATLDLIFSEIFCPLRSIYQILFLTVGTFETLG